MMKTTTLAIAAAMAAGTLAHAQDAVQWRVEDGGNGHWYDHTFAPFPIGLELCGLDWHVDFAAAYGAYPVTITSAEEEAHVLEVLPNYNGTYSIAVMGLYRESPAQPWVWVNGEPFAYSNFIGGISNGLTAHLYDEQSTLGPGWRRAADCFLVVNQDSFGGGGVSVILEWSADCNGDGIVDYGQCRDGSLPDYNGNNIPDCCEQGVQCEVGNYPVQWRVEDGGNGHWYAVAVAEHLIDWVDASDHALARGATLATFELSGEFEFVVPPLIGDPAVWTPSSNWWRGPWIGGFQDSTDPLYSEPSGGWKWVTGTSISDSFFDTYGFGNPNNFPCCEDHLQIGEEYQVASVNDVSGALGSAGYLLEWSADCNGDGIVDYGQILDGTFEDANENGVPDCCEDGIGCDPCPGDVNFDGIVNGADISVTLGFWGLSGKPNNADINNDGIVNGADLAFVLGNWGPCP